MINFAQVFNADMGEKIPHILYAKKLISKEVVTDIVRSNIQGTEVFLVGVLVDSASRIKVEVDTPVGITIDRCVEISRAIESALDRDKEDFELEVSSPGLGSPLKVVEQYHKYRGKQVDVVTKDGQKQTGVLLEVDNAGIVLEVASVVREKGKKVKEVKEGIALEYGDIKSTRVVITF